MTVTAALEEKIRFLCGKLPQNEWSGTLFYTVEGSFEEHNLHFIAKDFYLQDVGESTFTQFKNDVTLASYMVDNDLLDCYVGLCHSHNNFSCFFSGTDINTLREEGNDANHFLSLIVNNAGEYTAAVTRKILRRTKATIKGTVDTLYKSWGDAEKQLNDQPFEDSREDTKTIIEYYMLEIEKEPIPPMPISALELRLNELLRSQNSYINSRRFTSQPTIPTTTNIYKPADFKKEEPKEQTLFDKKDWEAMAVQQDPIMDTADLIKYHCPEKAINDAVLQILTGDIMAPLKKNLDITAWGNNMSTVYDKRFKVEEDFKYFADGLADYLVEEFDLPELEAEVGLDGIASIFCNDIINKLMEYPENTYLDYYITTLSRWLI